MIFVHIHRLDNGMEKLNAFAILRWNHLKFITAIQWLESEFLILFAFGEIVILNSKVFALRLRRTFSHSVGGWLDGWGEEEKKWFYYVTEFSTLSVNRMTWQSMPVCIEIRNQLRMKYRSSRLITYLWAAMDSAWYLQIILNKKNTMGWLVCVCR